MDPYKALDYADQGPIQGPLPDRDMEEERENLAAFLKHMPDFMNADNIQQCIGLLVPVRTVQEAVAAGDLPPLDVNAAFSKSEHIPDLAYKRDIRYHF